MLFIAVKPDKLIISKDERSHQVKNKSNREVQEIFFLQSIFWSVNNFISIKQVGLDSRESRDFGQLFILGNICASMMIDKFTKRLIKWYMKIVSNNLKKIENVEIWTLI